jgi:hypothetical protein
VKAIDARVKKEIERREQQAAVPTSPDSGLNARASARTYSAARVPVSVSIAGVGVAGLGIGVGFLVHSGAKKEKAEDLVSGIAEDDGHCADAPVQHPDCEEANNLRDSSDDAQHIAVGSFVAGGALLVGGALTYFLWPKSKVAQTARPVITFERETAEWNFALQGQF